MSPKRPRIALKFVPLILALLSILPSRLPAEMSLQAVACTLPLAHFALIDSISGDRRWISLGDAFSGFTARSYDPVSETLVLARDGQSIRLALSRSSLPATPDPAPEPATSARANDVERAYWLATARDQQVGGFMQRLGGAIKGHVATAREWEAAEAAFARDPSREHAQDRSDAKRRLDTTLQPEIFLWTRAVEPAATR